LRENLKKTGIKKAAGKIISFLAPFLVIRHKNTKIEYTIKKIGLQGGKPVIICYRYYKEGNPDKKVYIKIEEKDFNDYEKV
jgi:hypothetical protein